MEKTKEIEEVELIRMLDTIFDGLAIKREINTIDAEGRVLMEEGDVLRETIIKTHIEDFPILRDKCGDRLKEIKDRLFYIMNRMDELREENNKL